MLQAQDGLTTSTNCWRFKTSSSSPLVKASTPHTILILAKVAGDWHK
jgi:hypothetical protein